MMFENNQLNEGSDELSDISDINTRNNWVKGQPNENNIKWGLNSDDIIPKYTKHGKYLPITPSSCLTENVDKYDLNSFLILSKNNNMPKEDLSNIIVKENIPWFSPVTPSKPSNEFYNIYWKSLQFLKRLDMLGEMYEKLGKEPSFKKKFHILNSQKKLMKKRPVKLMGIKVKCSEASLAIREKDQLPRFKKLLSAEQVEKEFPMQELKQKKPPKKIRKEKKKEDFSLSDLKTNEFETSPVIIKYFAKPTHKTSATEGYEDKKGGEMNELKVLFSNFPQPLKKKPVKDDNVKSLIKLYPPEPKKEKITPSQQQKGKLLKEDIMKPLPKKEREVEKARKHGAPELEFSNQKSSKQKPLKQGPPKQRAPQQGLQEQEHLEEHSKSYGPLKAPESSRPPFKLIHKRSSFQINKRRASSSDLQEKIKYAGVLKPKGSHYSATTSNAVVKLHNTEKTKAKSKKSRKPMQETNLPRKKPIKYRVHPMNYPFQSSGGKLANYEKYDSLAAILAEVDGKPSKTCSGYQALLL